jgi:heme/copper-type cytochrome/quinol oxidase subunit 2
MKNIELAKKAIALPLVGLIVAWALFGLGQYSDLLQNQAINRGQVTYSEGQESPEYVHASVYLFLVAISVFSLTSLFGQAGAIKARIDKGETNRLARAAQRFATLCVVIGLAFGAIFAIGNFMSAFNRFNGSADDLVVRIFDVYLPIVLATALVVFVILRGFVFRQDMHEIKDDSKKGLSDAQKALGLGYAVPILATAVAIIFGLVVYDVTRTELQVWIWVIIQLIVATGIVAGTRFAAKAKSAKPSAPKPRTALAAGAASLNFVLSIVFAGVVSIMSFAYLGTAISKLQQWNEGKWDKNGKVLVEPTTYLEPVTLKWAIEELAPAKVLLVLAVVGIYVTITQRNKEVK